MDEELPTAIYNSVTDKEVMASLLRRMTDVGNGGREDLSFTVGDVVDVCAAQKTGKAVGLDGVAMEALMYGGTRLHVHLCILFNIFLKHGYVPIQFMKCVITPLAKCKTGDLSDVNN